MRKLLLWFRSHPSLSLLGLVIALSAGLHFFFQWRTERRWERYCTEARARGVKLDLVEWTPPPIPDDQNFAMIPVLKEAFAEGGKHPLELPGEKLSFGSAVKGERMNWLTWQAYFKAQGFIAEATDDPVRDCLRALDRFAPQFQQWSEWRTRPKSQFPLDLKLGSSLPLPHLTTFQHASRLFSLRMRAHLALGDSAAAYDDFRDGLQAYLALQNEPTTIDGLVRISVMAVLIHAVGCGLQDQAWAEADLRKIERDIAAIRIWADYRHTMECEHAFCNGIAENLIRASLGARLQVVKDLEMMGPGYAAAFVVLLLPDWVLRENQLRLNRYYDEAVARVDLPGEHIDQDRPMPSSPGQLKGVMENRYFFLVRSLISVSESVEQKYFIFDARMSMLRIACALEEFRQQKGSFPAALEELPPAFLSALPIDPYNHAPFHYQRATAGTFQLYSVGANRLDDHGVVDPSRSDAKQDDEIWLYSPAATR